MATTLAFAAACTLVTGLDGLSGGSPAPATSSRAWFIGPKGDPSSVFRDDGLAPPARGDLTFLPETRFLQYRLHLETDDPNVTPSVLSVTLVP